MSTASDITAAKGHLDDASTHLTNGVEAIPASTNGADWNAVARENLAAAVFDIADAQVSVADIAADIEPPPPLATLVLAPLTAISGTVGKAIAPETLKTTGGTGAVAFTTSAPLPAGLTLTNGVIAGTPTAAFTGNDTVTATDQGTPKQQTSAALALNILPAVTPPPPPPTGGKAKLFVYTGNGNLAGAQAFAKATGKKLAGVSDYCSGAAWSGITNPPGIAAYKGSGLMLGLGVNPGPDSLWTPHGGNTTATWQSIIAGTFDTYYKALVAYLESLGFTGPECIFRPAWEPSGGQPWSPTAQGDNALIGSGIAHIGGVLKAAMPGCLIDCNPLWGGQYANGQLMNSAAEVVANSPNIDIIGCDMYDQTWDGTAFPPSGDPNNTATAAQSQAVWNDMMATNSYSPQYWINLGKSNGKAFSIPETGTNIRKDGHGMGDDPNFWTDMEALVEANDVAYISVYNFNDGSNNCVLTGGSFPKALAAFMAATTW